MRFSGKVALITGASRGIGRAVAKQFALEGANVALVYHESESAVRETLALLGPGHHLVLKADIGNTGTTQQLVEEVVRDLGGVDILVNNAGVYLMHPIKEMAYPEWEAAWRRTLDVNLNGPAHLSYCVARQMMRQGGGRIVNISSRGAFRGEPDAPGYGASKAGLNAFSQSMAQALAQHHIYVFVLAPGWVNTDMAGPYLSGPGGEAIRNQSPLGRAAEPEEMARIVLFLAAEGSEYMTGCIIDANGASYLRT
jgi:NAD(P)-dependent dehydrogenase (short-subunit alcohol dehydrogenase family)